MNNNKSESSKKTLYLKLDGEAFEDGIYIHTVIASLSELQYILDRSYLAFTNRKNLMSKERTRYRLVAHEFRQGSFITLMDIVVLSTPFVIPLIAQIGPENIWEYTKTTFEFLKLVFSLNQEKKAKGDQSPPLTITGEGSNINVNYGEQTINFNAPVLDIGKQVLPSYRNLTQLMKSNELHTLQFGDKEKTSEIQLDAHEKYLFDVKPEILRTSITVNCEIFMFNKDTGHGKLRVGTKQAIPRGEYNFIIAKSRNTRNKKLDFAQSMLASKVIIECRREVLFDPFSPECTKIVKLHLLSVDNLPSSSTVS